MNMQNEVAKTVATPKREIDPQIRTEVEALLEKLARTLTKRVYEIAAVHTKERSDAISFAEFRKELGQEHAHRFLGPDERNNAYNSPGRQYDTQRISGSLATLLKKIAAEYPELNPRIALLSATDPSGRANTLENLEQNWQELSEENRLVYPLDWYKKKEERHINHTPSCLHERLVFFLEGQNHTCNFMDNTKHRGRFVLENLGDIISDERRADFEQDLESLDGSFGQWLAQQIEDDTDANKQKAAAYALTALSLNRNTLPSSASQIADISRVVRSNGQDWLKVKYSWLPQPSSDGCIAYAGNAGPGGLVFLRPRPCYVRDYLGSAVVVEVS